MGGSEVVGAEHCVVVYLTHRDYPRPTVVIFVVHTCQVGMLVRARGVHFARGMHFARGIKTSQT